MPASLPLFLRKIDETIYILGGIFVFIIFFYSGIHYIIVEGKLLFKIWNITSLSLDIEDIVSVERSYNLFDTKTNTTASFKKLRLELVKRTKFSSVLVSPVREKEFIKELKAVNSGIDINVTDRKGIWRIWDWDV
jgi:hypothetical protein